MHAVKPTIIKVSLRVVASLAALLGLAMIFFALLHLPSSIRSGRAFGFGFSVLGVFLGFYLSYLGFLGWCRLSPAAVRQILGTLAFLLVGPVGAATRRFAASESLELSAVCFMGSGILFYVLYRWGVSYSCRHLFAAPSQDANAQIRNA